MTSSIEVSTVIILNFEYVPNFAHFLIFSCFIVMSKFERKAGEKTKEQLLTLLENQAFLDKVADDKLNSTLN